MAGLFAQEQSCSAKGTASCEGGLRSQRKHGSQSISIRVTDSFIGGRGKRIVGTASPCRAPHVHTESPIIFRHRLADRPDAFSILVEYLVWPAPVGQAAQRVSQRSETSEAHPTRTCAIGRALNRT